jgi:uncharacterized protein with WD repeat
MKNVTLALFLLAICCGCSKRGGESSTSSEAERIDVSLADLIPVESRAKLASEAAMAYDPGQGFESSQDELCRLMMTAQRFQAEKIYDHAWEYYQDALQLCADLQRLDEQRSEAGTARSRCESASSSAEAAVAEAGAVEWLDEGATLAEQATEAFEAGEFTVATGLWSRGMDAYAEAAADAAQWETDTFRLVRTLSASGPVLSASFSPDGRYLATASYLGRGGTPSDSAVRLWETGTGRLVETLLGHGRYVDSVSFSPDGRYLASASDTVKVWETDTFQLVQTFSGARPVSFSPDGCYLASCKSSGSRTNRVGLLETDTGRELWTTRSAAYALYDVSFSPDGRFLVAGIAPEGAWLLEADTGLMVRYLRHAGHVGLARFSPDGRYVVSASSDGAVKLWETDTGRELWTLSDTGSISSLSFSPDGRYVYVASSIWTESGGTRDNVVKLWETDTGRLVRTLSGHTGTVYSFSFSVDGRHVYMVSNSEDQTLELWEAGTGRP